MKSKDTDPKVVADKIHSAAIHVLRGVRSQDLATGFTTARLSALSVVVFAGPLTVGQLATAEQVSVPTISRMLNSMVEEGLVLRELDPSDRRITRLRATPEGKKLLQAARQRRIALLARRVETLSATERNALLRAAELLERIAALPLD